MAERILAEGEKGQHQCIECLRLFDFIGNGVWIPTTCLDCKSAYLEAGAGPMREHDDRQLFGIWIDYKSLDLETGKSKKMSFSSEVMAGDSMFALSSAMQMFSESERGIRPNCRVWDISAKVQVLGDVLRQKLDSTVVNGARKIG